MPDFTVSRDFDFVRTQLTDNTPVYDVFADGLAPVNGGGGTSGARIGRGIGRVHRRASGEWWATPEQSPDWPDLIWYGPHTSRREASVFLLAMWAPHPRYCPSCGAPVMTGDAPLRALFNRRDGARHVCP